MEEAQDLSRIFILQLINHMPLKPDEKTHGYFQFEKLFETDCCHKMQKSVKWSVRGYISKESYHRFTPRHRINKTSFAAKVTRQSSIVKKELRYRVFIGAASPKICFLY